MSEAEYWKNRAKLAEEELERLQSNPTPKESAPEPKLDPLPSDDMERVRKLLAGKRLGSWELLFDVAVRLTQYASDRSIALEKLRRNGYPFEDDPRAVFQLSNLIDGVMKDLASGRQTIEVLSRPPMLEIGRLPIGAIVVHGGQLLEVKREPSMLESTIVCYEWTREQRSATIDKKQMVSPIGRVIYDDRRKTICLGILELAPVAEEVQQLEETSEIKQLPG